ncbi:MAG TPA: selenoneine synthase SenA [Candidatus Acidoferrum sp.]|nr:selenoneine synthase SenA [Candidatus Acidoferrum sp.]
MATPQQAAADSSVKRDAELAAWVRDARQKTLDVVSDLSDEQLMGPQLRIVNPLLWEIGHVTWFQEKWARRHAGGQAPIRSDADSLYDSAAIAHDTRWDLPLPSRADTLAYMTAVRDRVLERIERGNLTEQERYFITLGVFHEDMHTEAFTYTRQTHGWSAPVFSGLDLASPGETGPLLGDAEIPGGKFLLGGSRDEPFVFDNEKWAHPVEVRPFAIARAALTQGEFAEFVEAKAYSRQEFWSEPGWQWRQTVAAEHPVYWKHEAAGRWLRRNFDRWAPLEPHRPVLHVSWWEAEAYCNWAGRRLPTELEWEVAASSEPAQSGRELAPRKRRFPWGDDAPSPERANLGWRALGAVDVNAFSAGDTAFGCRQMIGNVWEWTATDFGPYPGFEIDPYREYSQPWFVTHKVLRGGAWPTQPRLLRNTWRNFYTPDRRDVWAGFRTCRA